MRISDWSSDLCSSDLTRRSAACHHQVGPAAQHADAQRRLGRAEQRSTHVPVRDGELLQLPRGRRDAQALRLRGAVRLRSEEHTSELQSLMRISYAVFCLKKKKANKSPLETTT